MTSTITTTERKPAAERIAVRCVDSDVHPVPRSGELTPYIPEPWRSKYFLTRKIGDQIYYDAPDYAHAYAMRVDTFPADGQFPGSDPDLAFKQLIMEAGADIAILDDRPGLLVAEDVHWFDPALVGVRAACRPRAGRGPS
ncbi:MAG: hypothetical protein WAL26_29325, partial [Mycobacterium sp.]